VTTRVVVLGAGFGGMTAAIELARSAADHAVVTLVDREPEYYMGLTKLWVATGRRTAESCRRPRTNLARHGIDVVQADVEGIDVTAKTVATSTGSVAYDRLIIALGLNVDPTAVPGLAEHGLNLYSMDGAERIASVLSSITGNILVAICAPPFKCPPAPYEAAMMLAEIVRARVDVITPEPRPMPILPADVGARVVGLLTERGIGFSPEQKIVAVEPGVARLESGDERRFDLLVAIPPHKAPVFLAEVPGLTDASGLVVVDRETLTTQVPDVYAVGDVAKALSHTELPIPRAGILAEAEAKVVAANVASELRGETPAARFDGRGYCFIETGDGRALKADGDFYAQPAPAAVLPTEPTKDGLQEKEQFEAERLTAWFGD
jgi:sulfide:quinone oxidoreductase